MTPARAAGLAGLFALAAGALALNRNVVGVFYDDGLYAGLAWALGHGAGYVYPNLPGTPAAIHYPPGYPLLLAPLFRLLSVPAAAMTGKVINVLCAALAAALIAWHAVRHDLLGGGPRWLPVAVVAAAAIAIPWLSVLTALMSEPLFAVLGAGAVALADRPPRRLGERGAALAAGLGAAAALLVRSIGVAIGIGVVLQLWRDTRRAGGGAARAAWAAAPCVVAAAAWTLWVRAHRTGLDPLLQSDYGSYLSLVSAGTAGATGLSDLVRPVAVLTLNWVPTRTFYYLCGIPALCVGLCGLVAVAKRSAIGMALIAYLGVLALWPVPPDRFLWAVLPWLGLAWAAGAVMLWRTRVWRIPVLVIAAALSFGFLRYEVRGLAGRWWTRAGADVAAALPTVLPRVDSLPPDAVIAADHEPLVWLYTRRSAVPFYLYALAGRTVLEPPPDVHRAYLERQRVTYILAGADEAHGGRELERLQAAYPGWLGLLRRWPDGRSLYAVRAR